MQSRPKLLYLSNIVEREPGQEDISKKLCHTEESIHHPIGQPFSVIVFGGTFNGLNAAKREEQDIREMTAHERSALKSPLVSFLSFISLC